MRPVSKQLQQSLSGYKGNFGLYFDKFIDLPKDYKPGQNCYADLKKQYDINDKKILSDKIANKQKEQKEFCKYLIESYKKSGNESENKNWQFCEIEAVLDTPLITGIGESSPAEVGMVFDHTLGIPYIPASGIKGIVRFSHLLELVQSGELAKHKDDIKTDKESLAYFDDEADWTFVPQLFGRSAKGKGDSGLCGSVVFLDAYPVDVPELHLDIMNPHYDKYYSDQSVPPADYCVPTPIKFLTVARGTKFVFRFIVKEKKDEKNGLFAKAKSALEKAIFENGVGAKTAVGYGRFVIEEEYNEIKFVSYSNKGQRVKSGNTDNEELDEILNAKTNFNVGDVVEATIVTTYKKEKYSVKINDDIRGSMKQGEVEMPQELKKDQKVKVKLVSVNGMKSSTQFVEES